MEVALAIFLGIVVVAVVVAGVYLAHKAAEKRRLELAALAAELGWTFDPAKDKSHDERYTQFEVFRQGHSRAAFNTLTGSMTIDGRPFQAVMGDFTYAVTRSNGKSTTTTVYTISYLIVRLPFRGSPDLLIRPESIMDKIAAAIGFDDIDFESAEFSRTFMVKGSDKRLAYDIIHPRMMEFLLLSAGGRTIDIERGCLCLTSGSARWSPDNFRHAVRWTTEFFGLWPDHLTRDLDTRSA